MDPQLSDPELDQDEPTEAHYVRKADAMAGYIEGTPVMALCGVVFVPSRNPERLPTCQRCQQVIDQMRNAGSN